jgi:hypothetical protein
MRRAYVRELLQDVGVGLEAGGRALIFCQESDAVIDHVVGEDSAVGILCGLRRIETYMRGLLVKGQPAGSAPLLARLDVAKH